MTAERKLDVIGAVIALFVCYFIFGIFGVSNNFFSQQEFTSNYWSNVFFAISAYVAWAALHRKIDFFEKKKQKWEAK